jgi:hypothetical protein
LAVILEQPLPAAVRRDLTSISIGRLATGCIPLAANGWKPSSTGLSWLADIIPADKFSFLLLVNVPIQVIQSNHYNVRYGAPTLATDYSMDGSEVPEPASLLVVATGSGAPGLAALRGKK